jgi:hypothetical protein
MNGVGLLAVCSLTTFALCVSFVLLRILPHAAVRSCCLLLGVCLLPITQGKIHATWKETAAYTATIECVLELSLVGCDPPPPAHSSLLMVLSVDSPVHNKFPAITARCTRIWAYGTAIW